jgi:hypothetical protein
MFQTFFFAEWVNLVEPWASTKWKTVLHAILNIYRLYNFLETYLKEK